MSAAIRRSRLRSLSAARMSDSRDQMKTRTNKRSIVPRSMATLIAQVMYLLESKRLPSAPIRRREHRSQREIDYIPPTLIGTRLWTLRTLRNRRQPRQSEAPPYRQNLSESTPVSALGVCVFRRYLNSMSTSSRGVSSRFSGKCLSAGINMVSLAFQLRSSLLPSGNVNRARLSVRKTAKHAGWLCMADFS
jgi:hypothetical protein